jgi:hypothetical protein
MGFYYFYLKAKIFFFKVQKYFFLSISIFAKNVFDFPFKMIDGFESFFATGGKTVSRHSA